MKFRKDFVTNSSSSCFVCDTKRPVGDVKFELKKMLDFYNSTFGSNLTFDEVFQEPFVYTEDMLPKTREKKKYSWDYEEEETVGKVIIMSADDNSIPYELFDMIESKFKAWREHLG